MRRWHWQDARGMTLMEMLVAIAILTIVMGAVSSVFMASLQAYWKGDQNTQIQQSGRIGLDRLSRDFRQARRLCPNTGTGCGIQSGFTFISNGGLTACSTAPQISFVLPHFGDVFLSDGSKIYMTDAKPTAPNQGQIPYDGSWVSYYLAASTSPWSSADSTTWPNASGPYLKKTVWDLTGLSLSTVTVASNITALTLSDGVTCPTGNSRELTVALKASLPTNVQPVPASSEWVTTDIDLRNPPVP